MVDLLVNYELMVEMLGGNPEDRNIHESFVSSKAPTDAKRKLELDSLEHVEKSTSCVLFRMPDGTPAVSPHIFKGQIKAACKAVRDFPDSACKQLKNYVSRMNMHVHVYPVPNDGEELTKCALVPLVVPEGGEIGHCVRPVPGNGPQGPRTAIKNSETVPAGTTFSVIIRVLMDSMVPAVKETLRFGQYVGLGEWRASNIKGRFTHTIVSETKRDFLGNLV